MAKPDLDDGFLQIAHELFAALMVVQMPKEARIVLSEVISQVYGPAKRKAAILDPLEIARLTGLQRPHVWRGITFLVKHGMLVRSHIDDSYQWVKDYEKWGCEGEPLMPPRHVAFALCAPDRTKAHRREQGTKPARARTESGTRGRGVSSTEFGTPSREANTSDSDGAYRIGYSARTESGTRIPISDKEEVVVVVEGESGTNDRVPDSEQPTPTVRGANGDPALWSMVPFQHDPADVDAMATLCGELAGPEEDTIPGNVRRMSRSYPLWYFRYAIMRGLAATTPGRVWRYAVGVMNNLWARGILHESELTPQERIPAPSPIAPDPFGPAVRTASPSRLARTLAAFDDPRSKERS